MFRTCKITQFDANLDSLSKGRSMFYQTSLTSFSNDLPSLSYGPWMFYMCKSLTSFTGSLPSLTNGWQMFRSCKLDTASLEKISSSIKDVTNLTNGESEEDDVYKVLHLGIMNTTPSDIEKTYLTTIADKGWVLYVNGSSETDIFTPVAVSSIDNEETTTPIPFYAKPIPSDEESGEYIDSEGNYYNILGAQFIYGDDLSTYGMFTCEADAAANMRLTKIEK
jgi:hypothetical protein